MNQGVFHRSYVNQIGRMVLCHMPFPGTQNGIRISQLSRFLGAQAQVNVNILILKPSHKGTFLSFGICIYKFELINKTKKLIPFLYNLKANKPKHVIPTSNSTTVEQPAQ